MRPARQPGVDDAAAPTRPIEFVRTLNMPAFMNGAGRGTLPPGDPHHFQLSRRYAFHERRPHHHRRHAVRLPDGLRQAALAGRDRRADRPRLPHRRQEPRHRPRHRRRRGRWCSPRSPRPRPAASTAARRAARRGSTSCARSRQPAFEKRLPRQKSDASPIHPYRLVHEINEFLTEDSIYIGDGGDIVTFSGQVVQPKSPGHWMDPGPLGHARRRRAVRARGQARPARQGGRRALRGRRVLASPAGTSRRSSATTSPSSASSATTPR